MRERNRDWPVCVRTFAAWMSGDEKQTCKRFPDALWKVVRGMESLWNVYAVGFEALMEETKDFDKDARTAALVKFETWRNAERNKRTDIPPDCRNAVHERFGLAVKKYFADLKARKGSSGGKPVVPPKVRKGPTMRFCVPFASRVGGFPVERIGEWDFRVHVGSIPPDVYAMTSKPRRRATVTSGHFNLFSSEKTDGKRVTTLDETIPLRIHAHRPFPTGSIIKRVSLCGELVRPFGWKLSLQFTAEVPPDSIRRHSATGRAAAIDVGWRHLDGYMRIAVVADTDGNVFELRLPDDFTNLTNRKFIERKAGKAKGFKGDSLAVIREMDSIQDGILEASKKALAARFAQFPDDLRPDKASWHLVRKSGLMKLLGACRKRTEETGEAVGPVGILEQFAADWTLWAGRIRAREVRMINSRDTTYYRFADWLARRYDRVVWEGDLSLKTMAEQDPAEIESDAERYALVNAAKYRQFASIHGLRLKIVNSLTKHGRDLVPHQTAGTSQHCSTCGAAVEPSAKLIVKCEAGHEHDQDVNSARLMLATLAGTPEVGGTVEIPPGLRKYIVQLSAKRSGVKTAGGSRD